MTALSPAWVQAIGSVLAIFVSIFIVLHDKSSKEKNNRKLAKTILEAIKNDAILIRGNFEAQNFNSETDASFFCYTIDNDIWALIENESKFSSYYPKLIDKIIFSDIKNPQIIPELIDLRYTVKAFQIRLREFRLGPNNHLELRKGLDIFKLDKFSTLDERKNYYKAYNISYKILAGNVITVSNIILKRIEDISLLL